ncbi:MAG TPA: DNA mismatch repair protein MutS [Candidatus Limnocylindrales bacterium]|nr:DNA mismatch repair protein MutS [Candidatus Limnocylindrales bacterium]
MDGTKVTPMLQQYLQIKERYQDAILFFRLGDFYEMFFEDAHVASKVLDITLTSRNKSDEGSVPLCGVPYHSAQPYIQKLLEAGHKVAVCEQVEDPALAKGVVKREVVRVITPGTVTADEALDGRGNNFLAAVCQGESSYGLAVSDITTGEFRCSEIADEQAFLDELGRVQPSEIVVAARSSRLRERIYKEYPTIHMTSVDDETFADATEAGPNHAAGISAEGARAAAAIINYLTANIPESVKLLRDLQPYVVSNFLILDEITRVNLELLATAQGDRRGSLLAILDRTQTPIGARRMRQWLLYPLLDEMEIRARYDAVQELAEGFALREDLKLRLEKIQDLERLSGRVLSGSATPKDLIAIKQTLEAASSVRQLASQFTAPMLVGLCENLQELPELVALIGRAIIDDPPFAFKEGGFIRPGFDGELDEIRGMRSHAKDWIAQFEAGERKRSGITSLKVRYNRVFGYFIEVTNSHLKSVPADYIRKQTLANGERYFTPELKEYEAKVLNSESLMEKLEANLLTRVREQAALHYPALKVMSNALAILDVLAALADVAETQRFVRPRVDNSTIFNVREGRHPVVENAVGRGAFVPNDCKIDAESEQIILLTGPNMAGKSTYMRQNALIVILAQMGGFVPAAEARIGIVDRIFTRIGAADSLARGESTFMVEMKETANILHHASRRSLILLDEVGRGTSTFDGISIAWAVAESLHENCERPRTLFATHYHELTELALNHERIKNFNFAVKEWRGEIIFLRNLVAGAASHSYGIHVARLAGMPAPVIERAKLILARLEDSQVAGPSVTGKRRVEESNEMPVQMGLFNVTDDRLRNRLNQLDIANLTPIQALNVLHELSEEAKK